MMILLRSATLLAVALTLANCCMSGTGCTGKDAAVGIALHTSKGEMSTIVKATPDAEGNWSTTLNIP